MVPIRIHNPPGVPGPSVVQPLPAGISVVVPVYNSAETLPALLEKLEPVLEAASATDGSYEVVLVNDGSVDGSADVLAAQAEGRPWVRGFNLMRNYGQHNATLCGIRAARFDTIVTIDDDLQHPPEGIPTLLAELKEGHDVVYGMPLRRHHGLFRNFASVVTKIALRGIMGAETAAKVTAWRAFRTNLRDAFAAYQSPFVSIDVLLTWATTRFAAVRVAHAPRYAGASNYNLRKLASHFMNMMTGFSIMPLRLASWIGFSQALFGVGVLAWVLGRYFIEGSNVPGFPFLASVIAIFSGTQLLTLGIFGEYLGRIHSRTMEQPPYAIRWITRPEESDEADDHG